MYLIFIYDIICILDFDLTFIWDATTIFLGSTCDAYTWWCVFLDDDAYGCHDFYLYVYRYLYVMIPVYDVVTDLMMILHDLFDICMMMHDLMYILIHEYDDFINDFRCFMLISTWFYGYGCSVNVVCAFYLISDFMMMWSICFEGDICLYDDVLCFVMQWWLPGKCTYVMLKCKLNVNDESLINAANNEMF